MRFIGPDVITPIRGKTLPMKVRKDSGYAEVFTEALVKRQAHDQVFDSKTRRHIKLFPQRDEHLFFSVPGVRDH